MRLIKHPILCNYYVTYRCNASCSFCDIWEKPSPYVTPDEVARNLDDLKRLGVRVIDFTGGEPLLHRQLPELLQLAKERGFITTVTTNGLLYPKRAEALHGLVDMLHFSLDAATAEVHDTGRGVKCFDKVIESVSVARDLKERPDILFTVLKNNIADIEQVYEEICLPNKLILILNPIFEYNEVGQNEQLTPQELNQLQQWAKKPNIYLNNAFITLRKNGGNQRDKPVCKAASSAVVISPENKLLLPCYHLGLEDFDIEGNLYNLWKSEEVQQLISKEGTYPQCQGCTINCYMQPSFAVEINKYWFDALPSTLKYNRMKGTWKQLLPWKN
jgi:MoaA/NifB/PqqE/SkfB family radical SAM enzyme